MIFEKFWKNSLKSPFLIKNQYFHQKLFFYLFFLIFVALLGQMYRNMQKNCYLNGRPYLRAKSTPFSRFAIFCMSGIVHQIVHRVVRVQIERHARACVSVWKWLESILSREWFSKILIIHKGSDREFLTYF